MLACPHFDSNGHNKSLEQTGSHYLLHFFTYRYRMNSRAIPAADRDPRNTPKGEHTLSWCGYADDLVLLTKSQNSLDTATSELSRTFGKYSLMVNPTKTETMISNFQFLQDSNPKTTAAFSSTVPSPSASYPSSIIQLDNKTVQNTEQFRYLGA